MNEVKDKEILKKESDVLVSKSKRNIVKGSKANDLNEVLEALKEDPKCINNIDSETRMSALHWSGVNGNYSISELLFNHEEVQVDPLIKDKWNRTPADMVLGCGNQRVIDLFQQNIFPEDFKNDHDVFDPPEV